ncbi:transposase (fragment) [Petrocella atlantisensis]|uniref:Transposase n=1 Tax=Petrocella atlantisensis TaxID=2173034 RepID=A0A3P7PF07_9FIRM
MKKIVIEFGNERLITPSGLSLVGAMLGKSDLVKRCNRMSITDKRSQPQIKNGDILLTYIGLLCQGKTEYDAVREMFDDPDYYKLALGITREIPSAETLRQRMDSIGSSLRDELLQANITMFQNYGIKPALCQMAMFLSILM